MVIDEPLERIDASVRRFHPFAAGTFRIGLGVTILLAGVHKLVAPAAWHAYLAPPFVDVWPTGVIGLDATFVLFGVSEVIFGLLLLAAWHTPTIAILTAISLLGVVANLAIAQVFGMDVADVLIRDLGLIALAVGVAFDASPSDASPD